MTAGTINAKNNLPLIKLRQFIDEVSQQSTNQEHSDKKRIFTLTEIQTIQSNENI